MIMIIISFVRSAAMSYTRGKKCSEGSAAVSVMRAHGFKPVCMHYMRSRVIVFFVDIDMFDVIIVVKLPLFGLLVFLRFRAIFPLQWLVKVSHSFGFLLVACFSLAACVRTCVCAHFFLTPNQLFSSSAYFCRIF